jgi:LacI family transcriptional regulator
VAVSVREVAALARVSVGTVSNVLNRPDKVAPDTVGRVQSAIRELGFVRNDVARQLRAGRSRSIGLAVLDVSNPFFTDLARGAETRAAQNNLTILLANSDEKTEREKSSLDLFEEQRVFGVLLSPVGDAVQRLSELRGRGIPAVLVDRPSDQHDVSSVSVDDVAGGRMAVDHLISQGRRRIAFVGGSPDIRQFADRLAGAQLAVESHEGVSLEIIRVASPSVLAGRAVGEQLRDRPAGQRPDAIFAANDLLAIGVLQALVMLGNIEVPRDVAIVGYDDIDFASSTVVPLSSVRQPSFEIGFRAVDLLVRESEGGSDFVPQQLIFQPELVIRGSTQP